MTVLILGETGVGKGLAARALHALSDHRDGPFIEVNCGALPGALIDSELVWSRERGFYQRSFPQAGQGGTGQRVVRSF